MIAGLIQFLSVSAVAATENSAAEHGGAWPTWEQLADALTFQAGFNTSVVVAGTSLLGIAAGVIGVFALLRKRALMSDAISHATLPGICTTFLLAEALGADGRSLPLLLLGAAVSGIVGVLSVQALLRHTRLQSDAAMGVVLSVLFGVGVVLLSVIQTLPTGNAAGLGKFIYGQTAAMSVGDAVLMGGIALLAVVSAFLLLKEFGLVCFDEDFAQVDGWPVSRIDLLMMALVVLVTVAGLQAVGLILVVAMLIIPPVAARFWTDRLGGVVVLSGLWGGLSGYLGSVVSALLPRQPAGAVIVLTSGMLFSISFLFAPRRGVLATAIRRIRLRLRIAAEHALEVAVEQNVSYGAEPAGLTRQQFKELARLRAWSWWFRPLVWLRIRLAGDVDAAPNGGLRLTPLGSRRGQRVRRNHLLWEQYLIHRADVAPSRVDWSVDQIEHVLPPEVVEELEQSLALASNGHPPEHVR